PEAPSILYENTKYNFTLKHGDVNYDPNDHNLTAEYQSMWNHVNKIKTTFRLKN
ncbi:MAG: hypothetical protein JWM44_3665, partial [Bacilli bacterium]|nr:hypothetical protein [Bacilli bacterium]